ncbi:TetR/AcrR family transcriptional regulator [Nocardia sp. NBC_00881]|uniref:TetR/AcrR family transcriptional regulator n=1 Tax=Nocardia sp. NBC_00881 TaxID=2975995 RepID=UPI00386D760C|nr:TetR/AcrR family transcriptional regulator [Nocardia sp. NBC_00881]
MNRPVIPIREQTRTVVRSLIAQTAIALFAENGYDGTTIDEVAAAAGVSRRTLFNYFKSKEDLALSGLAEQGDVIAARFAQLPADEDVWTSLRTSFHVLEEIEAAPERRFQFAQFIFGNDSLRAGHMDKQARWQDLLTPLIEERLPQDARRELQAHAIAAAAIACLHVAMVQWIGRDGRDNVFDLYDAAVAAVRSA